MARPLKEKGDDKTIIKQIMREKGITVEYISDKTGKAKSTISNLLSNGNLTISTLEIIAQALEVEISDLFPVKPGYVHYLEAKNIAMNIKNEQPKGQISDEDLEMFEKFKAFMAQEKTLTFSNK